MSEITGKHKEGNILFVILCLAIMILGLEVIGFISTLKMNSFAEENERLVAQADSLRGDLRQMALMANTLSVFAQNPYVSL